MTCPCWCSQLEEELEIDKIKNENQLSTEKAVRSWQIDLVSTRDRDSELAAEEQGRGTQGSSEVSQQRT